MNHNLSQLVLYNLLIISSTSLEKTNYYSLLFDIISSILPSFLSSNDIVTDVGFCTVIDSYLLI